MNTPQHIAIIMDGNGRWAKSRHLPIKAGHKKGATTAKEIARSAQKLGIKYLTLYAFSSENWSRPAEEVSDLMDIFRTYLRSDISELTKENVRVRFIGDRSKLDKDIQNLMSECEEVSKKNDFNLILAINYGSRDEIRHAAISLAKDISNQLLAPEEVSNDVFAKYLYTHEFPDPDLFIRTSGVSRISNFLLWQISYSELYFTEKFWPEFNEADLKTAIDEFSNRERRFGGR